MIVEWGQRCARCLLEQAAAFCEVALVSGPVRGERQRRNRVAAVLAFILSSCLQTCSAYHLNNRDLHRMMDMRHASRATTISFLLAVLSTEERVVIQIWRRVSVRHKAGPCSHVVLHFIDTSADNGSGLRARPSILWDGL